MFLKYIYSIQAQRTVFLAINEFVIGGTTPTGAVNTINGSQALVANATNYFWVAYDMNPLSTIGNLIDGSCSQITISGVNQIPTISNPAGNGIISICPCSFSLGPDVSLCAPINYTINGPAGYDSYVWSPGGATTQNLNVTATGNYTCSATIINGGLVVNGDFSSGNSSFTSNYTLGGGGTWGAVSNAGTYSVATNPNYAHSNFATFGDHTTGTGNMMICNGSAVANDIVWSQTITVTPNTNYNFSAWFTSALNSSPADAAQLQFSINGVLLGPVSAAPLTAGTWANFFVNWNSGTNTSAVITIVDQNIVGNNDFVLDDITFERVCVFSDVIAITASSSPTVAVPSNIVVCDANSIAALSFTSTPAGATFTWTNSNPSIGLAANGTSNTPTFIGTNSGNTAITSIITVTPSFGSCIGTPNTFTVTINPNPILTTTSTNSVICLTNTTSVNAIGASTYTWSGGVTNGIAFSPTVTTTYTVTGTSASGCTNTAVQTITVSSNPSVTAVASNSVIFAVPSWNNNHYSYLTSSKAVVIEATPEQNFMPTAADIKPYIKEATLIALCSPQNPTGTIFSKEGLEEICDLILTENLRRGADAKPLYLMYDQIYWALTFGNNKHYNPVVLRPEMKAYTVFVDGISKSLAATGVRVGWSMGPKPIIDKMKAILTHVGAWAPKAEQMATAKYLSNLTMYDSFIEFQKSKIIARLDGFYKGFQDLKSEGFRVDAITPQAAIYLTIKFDLHGMKTKDGITLNTTKDITKYILDEAKLAVVPFYAFGADDNSPWYRMSVGTCKLTDVQDVISNLRNALNKLS